MLLASSLIAVLAIWAYRERLWYQYAGKAEADLLQLRISVQELNQSLASYQENTCCVSCSSILLGNQCLPFGELSDEDKALFCGSIESSLDSLEPNPVSIHVPPDPVLFDKQGLLQILLLFSMMQFEFHYVINLSSRESELDGAVYRTLRLLTSRYYPLTMILVLSIAVVGSVLSWWNLLPMSRYTFASISLKGAIALWLSIGLSFAACNFVALKRYLPQDMDSWSKAVRDWSWWLWFVQRILGFRDLTSAALIFFWGAIGLVVLWPIRYLFYYRHVAFSAYASDIGADDDPSGDRRATDIFIVNIIGHTAVQAFLLFYCIGLLAVMPILRTDAVDYRAPASLAEAFFAKVLGVGRERRVLIAIFFPGCVNGLVLLGRALYFLCFGRGTWYCWWVLTVGVVGLHVLLFLCLLFSCNCLVQRNELDMKLREEIVTRIARAAMDAMPSSVEDREAQSILVGNAIFDRALEKAVQHAYLTSGLSSNTEKKDSAQTGEGDQAADPVDAKFLGLFHAILQTEAFAFRQQQQQEQEAEGQGQEEGGEEPDARQHQGQSTAWDDWKDAWQNATEPPEAEAAAEAAPEEEKEEEAEEKAEEEAQAEGEEEGKPAPEPTQSEQEREVS